MNPTHDWHIDTHSMELVIRRDEVDSLGVSLGHDNIDDAHSTTILTSRLIEMILTVQPDALAAHDRAVKAEVWDEGAKTAWERSTPEVNGQRYHWRSAGEPRNPYCDDESCGHPNHGNPDHACRPFLNGATDD